MRTLDMALGGIGILIFFGLVVRDWGGANTALKTGVTGADVIIKDLQLR